MARAIILFALIAANTGSRPAKPTIAATIKSELFIASKIASFSEYTLDMPSSSFLALFAESISDKTTTSG